MIITTADPKFRFDPEKHRYYYDEVEVPGVSSILKAGNLTNIGFIPRDVLERSSRFGTAVHKACELHDMGTLDDTSLDKNLCPYLDAWQQFLVDASCLIEHVETKVFSKKWFYMGTLDRIVVINGKRYVLDIKTGLIYPSMCAQLAGYLNAFNEGLLKKDQATDRIIVQLKENGLYSLPPKDFFEKSDFSTFTSCLNIYNWKKKRA